MATITEVFARSSFNTTPNSLFYVVPSGYVSAVVTNILIVNTGVSPETFTILLDGVEIFSETEIAGKATISIDMKQPILAPSGEITGSASSTNIKVHMSGVLVS